VDNNIYEQEIDLKDLIFAVLRKWRLVVLFAFIFTVLLGGYKCVKELMNQNDEEYVAELKDKYKTDQTKYEQSIKAYERDIESFNASLTNQEEYKEKSILLKVDPYNKGTASVDVFVKMLEAPEGTGITVTPVDFADSVVKAYASAIQQGGFLEDISREMGVDLIYIKELVTVTTDYDSNMLNVSVTYTDKEGAGKILDVILKNLETMYPEIQEHLGQHSLSIMNQDIGVITDQTLAEYQKQKVEDLAATNKNLEDTEKALKDMEEPAKPVVLSRMSIVKEGVKYGILGGFVGVLLVAFCVCIAFIMNGKVNTDEELKSRFGLKYLGSFAQTRVKKAFSGVDLWLDRLEGRDIVSDESVVDIISANIIGMLNKGESVFLTGLVEETRLEDLADKIQQRLSELKIGFGTNILRSAVSLQNLQKFDTVILVESRRQTKIRDIEKEIEIVRNMKKEFLGYIVMDPKKRV
jgi:capsular polysaccharide biosynthesis protein